jgi:tetratricopeptide (TPR) repeat protein
MRTGGWASISQAAEHIREAIALFRDANDRFGQAGALTNLAQVRSRLHQHERAVDCLRESLALFHTIGHPYGGATTLNGLGEALLAAGQPAEAHTHHSTPLCHLTIEPDSTVDHELTAAITRRP